MSGLNRLPSHYWPIMAVFILVYGAIATIASSQVLHNAFIGLVAWLVLVLAYEIRSLRRKGYL